MFTLYPPNGEFISPSSIKGFSFEVRHDKFTDNHYLLGIAKTEEGKTAEVYLGMSERTQLVNARVNDFSARAREAIKLIGGSESFIEGLETVMLKKVQDAIDASTD